MTGFGRAEASGRWIGTVEVTSVNHRFLEVRCRLPKRLGGLEPRIQQAIQGRFARGHLEVKLDERSPDGPRALRVDLDLARQYVEALRTLQKELDLPGEIRLEMLAGQRDLLAIAESEESLDQLWAGLDPALATALDALTEMRVREGAALATALERDLGEVEAGLARILARAPEIVALHRERLRERVATLLEGRLPDAERLEQEVALLADRSDVTEECDRLASHLGQFRQTLALPGPQGRRLDFLLQEMNREVNTIGSKAADAGVAQEVVGLKTALERLREQVQNLE
ncbi:MAG TPA: YicC/YloC family endoribonuclease [Candidatus Sulfotelmatobacter sp.]|nr:YicC/YloC family endoribonuclease [Candidatus Sulfotelmatobacter sp.]